MGGVKKHQVDFFELLSGLYLFLIILLVLIVSASADHKIFFVLIGFFPTILTIIISMLIHEHYAKHKTILWLLPTIIIGLFYFFGISTPVFAAQFDVELLTGVNFMFSIIYVLIVFSVFIEDFKKIVKIKEKEKTEKKSLQEYIHSIEDKSKALNFAIGRVYNKFHGGSKEIRDKLRIPSEWYNEFSLIGVGTDKIDFEKLNDLITKLELQLKIFEKTEFEVFKEKANSLKNLIRDLKGQDKIIEVMEHNDKDPIKSYYEGALEFCQKVKEEIKDKKIKLVKNEYIPKTEEELAEITGKPISKKITNVKSSKKLSDIPPIKETKKETDSKKSQKPKRKKVEFNRRPPNLHP